MNRLLPDLSRPCLRLVNKEHVIIENFKELKELSSDAIMVDFYIIYGKFLKINRMDAVTMEIYGEIKEIEVI